MANLRKTRNRKKDILLSDIQYNSTCITLELPHSICCDNCKNDVESACGMMKKSSKKKKRYRDLSDRRRCKQPWDSCHGSSNVTIATNKRYNVVREYLKINSDVTISYHNLRKQKETNKRHKTTDACTSVLYSTGDGMIHDSTSTNNIAHETEQTQVQAQISIIQPREPHHIPLPTASPIAHPPHIPTVPSFTENPVIHTPHNEIPSQPILTNDHLYTKILKRDYARLQRNTELGSNIKKKMQQKKYSSCPLARRLLGIAMMHVPKLSLDAASKFIPLLLASFLAECGFTDLGEITRASPSASELKEIMFDEAVDTIYLLQEQLRNKTLTLMCDKGDGGNKRCGASFVKLLARYDDAREKVTVVNVGIEGADNTSIGAAKAVDFTMKIYDTPAEKLLISNHGTDAGGGGTRIDLLEKLIEVGRVNAEKRSNYHHSTCSLHGLNITLSSPTLLTMGDGGLLKRNAMQTLHTAYNLTQQYERKEWEDIWQLSTGMQHHNMKCPVMTRWECVAEAVSHICKYIEEWRIMSNHIIATEKNGCTKHTIASYLSSYLEEKMILSHIHFLNAYCMTWWHRHFQWQKQIGLRSKSPGFLAIDMAVHYFVQDRDLKYIINNWQTMSHFKGFIENFQTNDEYTKEQFASEYFKRARDRHDKHFNQWQNEYLHLAIAGDHIPARYLSNWICGTQNTMNIPETYHSTVHKTEINSVDVFNFLTANTTPQEQREKEFYINHSDAILDIANGVLLWDNDNISEKMNDFKHYVKQNWLVVCTNTQLVERWVKDANECTYIAKNEFFSSLVAICRSATVFQYIEDVQQDTTTRDLQGNKFLTSGKNGERISKKTGEKEHVKRNVRVGASIYASSVITKTVERHHILSNENTTARRKAISLYLKDKNMQFRNNRNDEMTEIYANSLALANNHQPRNTIQQQTGSDTTLGMKGEVLFSSLRIVHIPMVRAELLARNHTFDPTFKIRMLASSLREICISQQRTGQPNTKSFLPISRPREEWKNLTPPTGS